MKQSVETTTMLELRLVEGPYTIKCQSETIQLENRQDAACLVLVTMCGRTIMHEKIVAITTDVTTFMQLRAFVLADGAIRLHQDLV